MKLTSNGELYNYLVSLSDNLKIKGAAGLSDAVASASRTAWTIPVTEFFGESRIALRRVLLEGCGVLTDSERKDANDILEQLDETFTRRG
jgi:hypothetical protein